MCTMNSKFPEIYIKHIDIIIVLPVIVKLMILYKYKLKQLMVLLRGVGAEEIVEGVGEDGVEDGGDVHVVYREAEELTMQCMMQGEHYVSGFVDR